MRFDRPIALCDANVLYPASVRDLLIRLARTGIIGARWTARIHDEWIRNLLANRPDLAAAQLQRTRELMDAAVPGAMVEDFEHRIPGLTLPDPDDRHVLAAAIEAEADVIVTFNTRDFPAPVVAQYGIGATGQSGQAAPECGGVFQRSDAGGLPRTADALRASGVDL